ncbi:glycosyltransferase family 39 protein [Ancylobacter terrae]|uniref:glycosyltransferase family 39 protein n=1 Tax=Ancylobacter sp. sgz301288 TaxID=3342077 RepID=UPI00385EC9B6
MLWSALWIEGLRARPGLVALAAAGAYALLWLLVTLVLFAAPPEALVRHLVAADAWRATGEGGLLAMGLSRLALRAGGVDGYYLLCAVAAVMSVWLVYILGRRMLGPALAGASALMALAGLAIGGAPAFLAPDRLVLPLLLWLAWEAWRYVGEGHEAAAPYFAGAAGIALFASWAGWGALAAALFLLLWTREGRRALRRTDPVRPLVVAMTFLAPFAFWLGFHGFGQGVFGHRVELGSVLPLIAAVAVGLAAVALLWLLASPLGDGARHDDAPELRRGTLSPLATRFLSAFIGAPALLAFAGGVLGFAASMPGVLLAAMTVRLVAQRGERVGLHRRGAVAGLWLMCVVAPAVIAPAWMLTAPYMAARGADVSFPAQAIAGPIAAIVERRTGKPPAFIAGETVLAGTLALVSPGHPRILSVAEADPAGGPSAGPAGEGAVAVWRIEGPSGEPPAALRRRWPALQPEAPVVVPWRMGGPLDPVRVGWALLPPAQ